MIRYGWICVRVCKHVAPWMIGAYAAVHPLATACELHCHLAIPPYEWQRGGMFWHGGGGKFFGYNPFAGAVFSGARYAIGEGGSLYAENGMPLQLVPPATSEAPPDSIIPVDVPEPSTGLIFGLAVVVLIVLRQWLRIRTERK